MKGAQHSSASPEHGTPQPIIELARETMGGIDVDPGSSLEWNRRVKAKRIITKDQDGLATPWWDGAPTPRALSLSATRWAGKGEGRLFTNPPGEPTGHLVARYWWTLAAYWKLGWFQAAIWVGFNLEQLSRLQRIDAYSHPLEHVTLIPAHRLRYIDLNGKPNDTPPHSSFVTLLAREARTIERFQALATPFGYIVNGDRR